MSRPLRGPSKPFAGVSVYVQDAISTSGYKSTPCPTDSARCPAAAARRPPSTSCWRVADEDRHGYAIIQEVAARTGGDVRLSAGTLYRSIQRMVEQDLIEETAARPAPELDDERRRYYRITAVRPRRGAGRNRAARRRWCASRAASRRGRAEGVMRVYRWLLRLCPASLREEYGDEMAATLRPAARRDSTGPRALVAPARRAAPTSSPRPRGAHADMAVPGPARCAAHVPPQPRLRGGGRGGERPRRRRGDGGVLARRSRAGAAAALPRARAGW